MSENNYPLKITILGTPGSGKTTLAKKLGNELNLPVYHLDKLMWERGWKLRDKKAFLEDQHAILNQSHWIVEGTAISTLEDRFQRSDVVIFLCPSKLICIYRVFKRLLLQQSPLSDKIEGNKERITWEFLKYLWSFEKKAKQKIQGLSELYPSVRIIYPQKAFIDITQLKAQ